MDNPWYTLSLGDGIMAPTPAAEIEQRFQQSFATAGKPADMAVFTRPESEGRLYCEIMAYFSPTAGEVAKGFGAQLCEKPARAGLRLLAGDEQAWSILFRDGEE
jgi:hypothetical protein